MITEYFMDKDTLANVIADCEEFANEPQHPYSDYLKEINKVKNLMVNDINMAWSKMLTTKVFYLVYGKWKNVYGNFVTVEK